ncbi:TetR family transcriptional regulator [Rhizobium sp. P38BS-XIX]|nr:TetR family transcriptional regulator [Rhizobium sp. P38BS-XIX]
MAYHHHDLHRALVDAALDLVTEEQAWDFSLRKVARRAGVSHNAPYNHFTDKRALLAEVAASGFRLLQQHLFAAIADEPDAKQALFRLANAYVDFASDNPALYRLMFGPMLADGHQNRPDVTIEAGAKAKTVLVGLLQRGAAAAAFSFHPENTEGLETAHLTVWSALHGLASFVVDRKAETNLPEGKLADLVLTLLLNGLANPKNRESQDNG